MENGKRIILVTGATGQQGGAVARHLLGTTFGVRALTRSPRKAQARALASRGAEVVEGDLEDRASLDRALEGYAERLSALRKQIDAEMDARLGALQREAGVVPP